VRFSNLPSFPTINNLVYGVESNYLDVAYNEYYTPTETDKRKSYPSIDGKPDAIKMMYSDAHNAELPEESKGIRIPPPIGSARRSVVLNDWRLNKTRYEPAIEEPKSYTEYVDVIVSEALRDYCSVSLSTPMNLIGISEAHIIVSFECQIDLITITLCLYC
jgi:hypothetical protein